ncbi:hypothetical protein B0181_11255 [Moraxella caviae]|uniref:Uncharacterized protein n=1 Tax=Moraxella caviae TaxID=34060 RepID=A0A1S9ZUJ1_9GAMM|nr:hypothetical protein [Moraxella caviae]OOR87057.1 hypothetical protein B0181_11255 [Moraxella caviae]STZ13562.1 Uncharacterised protein [Moraxella caviae]
MQTLNQEVLDKLAKYGLSADYLRLDVHALLQGDPIFAEQVDVVFDKITPFLVQQAVIGFDFRACAVVEQPFLVELARRLALEGITQDNFTQRLKVLSKENIARELWEGF